MRILIDGDNDLEKWFMEKDCNEKIIRGDIKHPGTF